MQLSFLPSPMADFANKLVNMEKDEKSDFSLGMKIYVGMRIQNSFNTFSICFNARVENNTRQRFAAQNNGSEKRLLSSTRL